MDYHKLLKHICSLNNNEQFKWMIIIYIVSGILLFLIGRLLESNVLGEKGEKINNGCVISANNKFGKVATSLRAQNYFWIDKQSANSSALEDINFKQNYCIFTNWALTHYLLYIILGFVAPDYFWYLFASGVLFEISEYIIFDGGDILDVFWNTAGTITGLLLRKRICANYE